MRVTRRCSVEAGDVRREGPGGGDCGKADDYNGDDQEETEWEQLLLINWSYNDHEACYL